VATYPLGQRLDDDGRTILCRTIEIRRREGVVDEHGHGLGKGVSRADKGGHVGDVDKRVADGLDVPELGVGLGVGDKGVDVVVLDERGLDTEGRKGVEEDVPRPAVERIGCHDVVARTHDVGDGEDLGRMAGGNRHGTGTTLDGGHASGNGIGGGVGETSVDVAWLGERELGGTVGGIIELERGGGVDGQRCGAGGGVGGEAGMNLQGVEVLLGILGEGGIEFEGHDGFLSVCVQLSCGYGHPTRGGWLRDLSHDRAKRVAPWIAEGDYARTRPKKIRAIGTRSLAESGLAHEQSHADEGVVCMLLLHGENHRRFLGDVNHIHEQCRTHNKKETRHIPDPNVPNESYRPW